MDITERCAWLASTDGLRRTLPSFVSILCPPPQPTLDGILSTTSEEEGGIGLPDWTDDQLEYIGRLIQAILDARVIVYSYNAVIFLIIAVLAVLHWREVHTDKRRWAARSEPKSGRRHASSSSSLSSTFEGTDLPLNSAKDSVDVERLPLLADQPSSLNEPPLKRTQWIQRAVTSWLARQPPPIPIVNKTLPSNGTSLFIGAWLALIVFFHFFLLPMSWDMFYIFADRAGLLFIVNLPLLYLLSAKNQPLRRLTGYSYEALNIFHRRVGEMMCFEALVHVVSMVAYAFFLEEEWLKVSKTPREYFTHPIILFGIGAFVSYELLYFTSLGGFRQRWYELFLASHVFLQVAALVGLWFHYFICRPYVGVALAIFVVDRIVWRCCLKRATVTADLTILEDGETFLLSADWDIPSLPERSNWKRHPSALLRRSIIHGWQPTDHVFVTIPALHQLQAHPFTISSAAPGIPSRGRQEPQAQPTHAWLTLLIRAHKGMTADLLQYARTNSRVETQLDGPYGSPHALAMLRASDCPILVAGGSGIAVTFPLIWALLNDLQGDEQDDDSSVEEFDEGKITTTRRRKFRSKRRVHLLWVTHARSHRDWLPQPQLDELVARGLDLVIPAPTEEAGRPDVSGLVGSWIASAAAEGQDVAVVVSGPDGLNRTVRNECADALGAGLPVRVAVEKFGW
ncbi:ferric reductase like transmembrane component-domain-containing protein [Podospora didyma]|uniref:Ferric reductase like transmembrane component-domain-containing protein n=1 Tax=Podospora didyma TaxID=330526 RepID=A0AAE0N6S5_9PEZI|nr:ferric reductase like transmembrane component-domain-containing protein [Podospora didyma]